MKWLFWFCIGLVSGGIIAYTTLHAPDPVPKPVYTEFTHVDWSNEKHSVTILLSLIKRQTVAAEQIARTLTALKNE